jgi:Protein of unknown function (DUF3237)
MGDAMFAPGYRPEYIFSYTAQVQLPPEVIGPAPDGIGANFYVISGEVEGPKLKGKIAPVGADWLPCALDLLLEPRYRRETFIPSMFELAGPWPPD